MSEKTMLWLFKDSFVDQVTAQCFVDVAGDRIFWGTRSDLIKLVADPNRWVAFTPSTEDENGNCESYLEVKE